VRTAAQVPLLHVEASGASGAAGFHTTRHLEKLDHPRARCRFRLAASVSRVARQTPGLDERRQAGPARIDYRNRYVSGRLARRRVYASSSSNSVVAHVCWRCSLGREADTLAAGVLREESARSAQTSPSWSPPRGARRAQARGGAASARCAYVQTVPSKSHLRVLGLASTGPSESCIALAAPDASARQGDNEEEVGETRAIYRKGTIT
jgi:hypothetical protein